MVEILIANGVNLDLLGSREPHIYGSTTLKAIAAELEEHNRSLPQLFGLGECRLTFFQSNCEASFLEKLKGPWHGALINPGAWTHTSLALADRLAALQLPFVEVHLSNLASREVFRQHSYLAPHALGVVNGFGKDSYLAAYVGLLAKLSNLELSREKSSYQILDNA
jgi:3-dehydroquinate dehydratase-2